MYKHIIFQLVFVLPETCVNKDEGKQEGCKGEDRLYCGNWVKSIIDVCPNKEQLPNLDSIVAVDQADGALRYKHLP